MVLSVLVIVHEFGHFIIAKKMGIRVEKFSFGFGPEIFGFTKGDTHYSISIIPLGGYVKLAGETPEDNLKGETWEYLSRSPGERARVIIAGPVLNYLLAFFIFLFIFMMGFPRLNPIIGGLVPEYPAVEAGLQPGDKILKIDGRNVMFWDDVTEIVHANKKPEIKVIVERRGKTMEFAIRPKIKEFKTIFGSKKTVGFIGITPGEEVVYVRYGILKSIYMAGWKLFQLTYLTYRALWATITGAIPLKESLTGPIGMFYITEQAVRLGILYVLHLMAVISASLAIFNLLPVPVLDGGHILFLVIERLRRRPIPHKVQESITQIGLAFIVCLMLFVFYNDFMRFEVFEKILSFWRR